MLKHYSKLLELPLSWSAGLVYSEAKAKFYHTYINVNNKIGFVDQIGEHQISMMDKNGNVLSYNEEEVQSISVIVPSTGWYYSKNKENLFYFEKIAKKQWKKSINPDFYYIRNIEGNSVNFHHTMFDTDFSTKHDVVTDAEGTIFYRGMSVGKKRGEEVVCTNPLFKQELNDWVKHGRYQEHFS